MPNRNAPGALSLFPLHPDVVKRIFYRETATDRLFREGEGAEGTRPAQPDIGSEAARFLEFLGPLLNARTALDLGTGNGFSAHLLATLVGPEGSVLTVERDRERAHEARAKLARSGAERRVAVLEGEARELLERLSGPYDLILLDIDKDEYIDLLDPVLALLDRGGHLIVDDIGFLSRQFEPRLRPLSAHVARFVDELLERNEMQTVYLPLSDGFLISRKLDEPSRQINIFEPSRQTETGLEEGGAASSGASEGEVEWLSLRKGQQSRPSATQLEKRRALRQERQRVNTAELRDRILRLASRFDDPDQALDER